MPAETSPWVFEDDDFYDLESRRDQMEFLLRYAVLAPSGHNTQPWKFTVGVDGIEISEDETRRLPHLDPDQRELVMSLGAAVTNLRVAAAHFGYDSHVLFPMAGKRQVMVTLRETSSADATLAALFPAIKRRHTNRQPFRQEALDPLALAKVLDLFDAYPDTFHLIVPQERQRAADLIACADREQMLDPQLRTELALWLRDNATQAMDGLVSRNLGWPTGTSGAAPFILRHCDIGPWLAHYDHELVMSAAFMIVVCSQDDDRSLVEAGQALEMMLLTITAVGLQYSFLNAPIQQAHLRDRVSMLAASRVPPQLMIRVGSGPPAEATPRRPVDAVVS